MRQLMEMHVKKLILLATVALGSTAFATNATTFDEHVVAKPLTYSRIGDARLAGNETCRPYAEKRCQDQLPDRTKFNKCVDQVMKYEC